MVCKKLNWYVSLLILATAAAFPFVASGDDQVPISVPAAQPSEQPSPGPISRLPGDVVDWVNKGTVGLGQLLSDRLFDAIGNINIYNVKLSSGEGRIKIGRSVLNNHDIEESYTVIDRMSMPIYYPALTIPLGAEFLTFNIGLRSGLDFANIRVVRPSESQTAAELLDQLLDKSDIENRRAQLEKSEWYAQATKMYSDPAKPATEADNGEEKPVFLMDNLRRARWGQLWNMISGPLALPLKASWLKHFDTNEVTTYGGYGTVEVGVNLGKTILPGGIIESLGATAGVRAYLRGSFQIAVKKSSDDKVKVKLMRRLDKGFNGNIGGSMPMGLYDGFLVAGSLFGTKLLNAHVAKIHSTIIPFSFSADKSWGDGFEIGYEYDLKDERAVEAYEQAVLGRLGLSEELSAEQDSPVTKLFTKSFNSVTTSQNVQISLQVIQKTGTSAYSVEDAMITFPDGKNHVFKATSTVAFKNEFDLWLIRTSEQLSYNVHTDFIEPVPSGGRSLTDEEKKKVLVGLIAEGQIEDTYTSGDELNRYSQMLEHLFGLEHVFPQVPEYIKEEIERMPCMGEGCQPGDDGGKEEIYHATHYGRSQFYFRIGVTEDQLIKFLTTPEERMWTLLEKGYERKPGSWSDSASRRFLSASFGWLGDAFAWFFRTGDITHGLGMKYHRANVFKRRWLKMQKFVESAKNSQGMIELDHSQKLLLARGVGEMFTDKAFTYELLNTLMVDLREQNEKQISFQVTAQSAAFPSFNLSGGNISEIEKVSQKYADETNFETPRVNQDVTLAVSNMKITQKAKLEFQVDYSAGRNPKVVMIRLDEVSSFLRTQHTLRRMIIPNRGQFHEGANTFTMKASAAPGYESELGSVLKPGKNYRLTIALLDETNAGVPESEDFYANPVRPDLPGVAVLPASRSIPVLR